jgi:hypothetical protein
LHYEITKARVETRVISKRIKTKAAHLLQTKNQPITPITINHASAEILFELVSKKPNVGTVHLIERDTCIGLYVEDQTDLQGLSIRGNLPEGFSRRIFLRESLASTYGQRRQVENFPFIVVRGTDNKAIEEHEAAHVYNDILKKTLLGIHPQLAAAIWGGGHTDPEEFFFFPNDYAYKINQLATEFSDQAIDEDNFTQQIEKIILACWPEALADSKNEILADFTAKNNFDWIQAVKIRFEDSNNSYEFFADIFYKDDLEKLPSAEKIIGIIKQFYEKYNDVLEYQGGYAKAVWLALQKNGLSDQKNLLLAFLRQNPLDSWAEQLSKSSLVAPLQPQVTGLFQASQAEWAESKLFRTSIDRLWELDNETNTLDTDLSDLLTSFSDQSEEEIALISAIMDEVATTRTELWLFLDLYYSSNPEVGPTPDQKSTGITLAQTLSEQVRGWETELEGLRSKTKS